jgi:hypothetical protein
MGRGERERERRGVFHQNRVDDDPEKCLATAIADGIASNSGATR